MHKRFTPEELAAAKQRLDASTNRGTDEEYNDYIACLVKSRDEYVRKLEAVAKAAKELCTFIYNVNIARVEDLTKLREALEALEGGEQDA